MRNRLSFRARILLAMVGTLALVTVTALLVVRSTTHRVTEEFVSDTRARSREAFVQVEGIYKGQLGALGSRYAASNRFAALLREMFFEPDIDSFVGSVNYELSLIQAEDALVAFTDLDGVPIAGVTNGRAAPDAAAAIPVDLMRATIERADTSAFGYHLMDGRLYAMHLRLLRLVDEPIALLVLGMPFNDSTATSLRPTDNGHICFALGDRCYASTLTAGDDLTEADMVRAMRAPGGELDLERNGSHWALISEPLAGGAGAARIIALPLTGVRRPFADIQQAIRLAGIGGLLLGLVLALLLARALARPIRALVHATGRVARGDYSVEVEGTSRDEIGALAASFNEMTRGLRLKEQYRGLLDKVVSPEIAAEMMRGEVQLGGETREVTTLFADIRGFTTMSEGMDPRVTVAMLNEVMERASAAVEAEGGVVDKYVGDEIMAIFGAPMSAPDDATRAVRAAVRIRDAVNALSQERALRGEKPLGVGAGISTGPVIAGNMGSARRLNYTVIGESVNVAARLCSAAAPQQILMTEATYGRVHDAVPANAAGERQLRGMQGMTSIYAVDESFTIGEATAAVARSIGAFAIVPLLAALAAAVAVTPVSAQKTLQLDLSGRFDIAAYVPGSDPPWLIATTRSFLAPRASVFADIFAGDHLYALIELKADRGDAPADRPVRVRAEQAFLRVSPIAADVHLQVGRFVSPFGEYPQRHDTSADPFLRPPLPYEHRTMIGALVLPLRNDVFLNWRNDPTDKFRPIGAPVVWGTPYQIGAMLFGARNTAAFRLAAMNSAPSSEPDQWKSIRDVFDRPSLVAHASYRVRPELTFGASYNRGPYLSRNLPEWMEDPDEYDNEVILPTRRDHYLQEMWAVNAAFARDRFQARAEVLFDRWDVPNVNDDPKDISFSAEAMLRVRAGVELAARVGAVTFNEIRRLDGTSEQWDYDVTRLQLAAGYRISASKLVRIEWLLNQSESPRPLDNNLLSARFDWIIDGF